MSTAPRYRFTLTAAASLLALTACSKSPTGATTLGPPATPGRVTFDILQLIAPPAVAPGQSVQLIANAIKSDGSVENVSARAEWAVRSVRETPALSLTASGVATGTASGEDVATVRYEGRTAEASIIVVPTGTFRLTGSVTANGVGLENARVTVASGVGAGVTAVTDFYGGYALYGVGDAVTVGVSKDGYVDQAQAIRLEANGVYSFEMSAAVPRNQDYAGAYTLTIGAGISAASCTAGFPEAAKLRLYSASVNQTGPDLTVSLTGAPFIVVNGHGNGFTGRVAPTGEIVFWIGVPGPWDLAERDLVERWSDGTPLSIQGAIHGRRTPAGIAGTVNPGTGGSMTFGSAGCTLDRFELARR